MSSRSLGSALGLCWLGWAWDHSFLCDIRQEYTNYYSQTLCVKRISLFQSFVWRKQAFVGLFVCFLDVSRLLASTPILENMGQRKKNPGNSPPCYSLGPKLHSQSTSSVHLPESAFVCFITSKVFHCTWWRPPCLCSAFPKAEVWIMLLTSPCFCICCSLSQEHPSLPFFEQFSLTSKLSSCLLQQEAVCEPTDWIR